MGLEPRFSALVWGGGGGGRSRLFAVRAPRFRAVDPLAATWALNSKHHRTPTRSTEGPMKDLVLENHGSEAPASTQMFPIKVGKTAVR